MELKKGDIILASGVDTELNQIEILYLVLRPFNDIKSCLCQAISNDVYEQIDGGKNRIISFNQIISIKDNDNEK